MKESYWGVARSYYWWATDMIYEASEILWVKDDIDIKNPPKGGW